MKIIQKSIIDGKIAMLILLDDNKTLKITLDKKVINIIDNIWDNIKDEDWAQAGLLKIEVESYIRKKEATEELLALAEKIF